MVVAFVPNSRKIVICGFEGPVLWDVETRQVIQRFRPQSGHIRCLAVSSDGRRVLTGSGGEMQKGPNSEPYDCTLRLWDADSGNEIRRFEGHTGPIDRVAFSPDGNLVISGSRSIQTRPGIVTPTDNSIRIWDLATGDELYRLQGHTSAVKGVAMTPDGRQMISCSLDDSACVWTLPSQSQEKETVVVKRPVTEKADVPSEARLKAAEKLIKDLFREEYAKRVLTDRLALADKLIEKAGQSPDDLALQYVLLREARDLALKAEDLVVALTAAELMAQAFAVDGLALKTAVLKSSPSGTSNPNSARMMVSRYLALVEEAADHDNFETAQKLISQAEQIARRADIAPLKAQVEERQKALADQQREYEKSQDAAKLLQNKPNDSRANLALGKYLCLLKRNWDKGLPLLKKSEDPKWSALADKELANPSEAAAQVELAGRWWDLARTESGNAKLLLQRRAYYWYQEAVALLKGAAQSRAERRIEELVQLPGFVPVESGRLILTFKGHDDRVTSVALSRNGKRALTGSADGSVRLWDTTTGQEIRRFFGALAEVRTVALSPDGRIAIAGGSIGVVMAWDTESGRSLRQHQAQSPAGCVQFSSDGRVLVYGGANAELFQWQAEGNLNTLPGGTAGIVPGVIHHVSPSADGRLVLFVGEDGLPKLWSFEKRSMLELPWSSESPVTCLALSPDGNRYATADAERNLRVWNLSTGRQLASFRGHPRGITGVAFSPDGQHIISASEDRTIRCWDLQNNREITWWMGHYGAITSLAVSGNGRYVLSGSTDKTARLWSLSP
jgi:WD40 repeat protein